MINENHDRYYLNRVCILETQSLWSKERSVMSSEDLKDWKEEVSIGDPECQKCNDFGGDNQRELETSGDKSCSLHQLEGTFAPGISRQFSEKEGIQQELV